MGTVFAVTRRHTSEQAHQFSDSYKFSDPLLQGSLSLKCGNILWIYSLGLGYTILDFDWLWFSAVISLLRYFLNEYYYY